MTNLRIRKILISDLKLFLIKGASCEENETCFLYDERVTYTREPVASRSQKFIRNENDGRTRTKLNQMCVC